TLPPFPPLPPYRPRNDLKNRRWPRARSLAAAALPPLAQEETHRKGAAGASSGGPRSSLPRAGVWHRAHLALPPRAGWDLGELRFRAGSCPLRQAARGRPRPAGGRARDPL